MNEGEQAHVDASAAYVNQIIQSGQLGDAQAAHLHTLLDQIPIEEARDVLQPLIAAANSGRVRIETEGMPF